ncbi:type II toxin-antitoxin system RelE/ParE family toxin [Paenirhodobacter populi]|uniref:type II toxin-antitoxin system RelE/ParE family toxin n=1 Tax=Paenirhodobacter populi TaxID=2306993 RepID=UPI000FE43E35|nr:type II toxin-antitoxin system RelE/ParE family toxin [Sinirhodobacter populi]RWR04047.1 type II toxin-antitoxin system RelE/ParE family toxin [Sinirhodobacter populi]
MTCRIRFHPWVADGLDWIAGWISDHAGASGAAAKLDEIEQVIGSLAVTPRKRNRRDEIAQGLRAIPAGRQGIIVFAIDDDDIRDALIYAVGYGGWIEFGGARRVVE